MMKDYCKKCKKYHNSEIPESYECDYKYDEWD